jgi:catechol 2,3-dioxygenase-like lactoylglutathione lyase family enzyme
MNQARTDGLRSIELGVRDLQKSAEFYRKVWALEDVAAEGDSSTDHHVVTLRGGRRPAYWACTSRPRTAPPSMRCTDRPRCWAPKSPEILSRCRGVRAAATVSA